MFCKLCNFVAEPNGIKIVIFLPILINMNTETNIHILCPDVNECLVDPTLCRGQTHGACYNTPGGYKCGCSVGYHAHYFSATGTGSFTCMSE